MPRRALIAIIAFIAPLAGASSAHAANLNIWTNAGNNGGRAHFYGDVFVSSGQGYGNIMDLDTHLDDVCEGATKGDYYDAEVTITINFADGSHAESQFKDDRGCTQAPLPIQLHNSYPRRIRSATLKLVEFRNLDLGIYADPVVRTIPLNR